MCPITQHPGWQEARARYRRSAPVYLRMEFAENSGLDDEDEVHERALVAF